jgi:hypothetical protein
VEMKRKRRSRRRPSFGRRRISECGSTCGGEEEGVRVRESEGAAAGDLGSVL